MKTFIITGLTFCFLLLSNTSSFAVIASESSTIAPVSAANNNKTGKPNKSSLLEKFFIKALQKKAQKTAERSTNNKRGLLSLIIGGVNILLLLTPVASVVFFANIAGLIFGIAGLKRDQNKTMAILGIILNGLMILLIIAAIAAFLSL